MPTTRSPVTTVAAMVFCAVFASFTVPAAAQLDVVIPDEMKGVGIDERLDQRIPLDLVFTDETGKAVKLGDYFNKGRPIILTPVYYQCPMLCTLTLNGLVDGLNQIEWTAGKEFDIVTFSFNPKEGTDLADVKRRAYLNQYRRESAAESWHFHTGSEANIRALTEAIGYSYNKVEGDRDSLGEYAHSATIVFLTPDGRISLYMNDVRFEPRDLRLALVDASQGTIGSPLEKFLLFTCFQYDADANSFVPSAWKIMRTGGLLTLVFMAAAGFVLWKRNPKMHAIDMRPAAVGEGVS